MVLHPDVQVRPNLGALLIAHFRRQRLAPSGDIRIGGLVTQILISQGIAIPSVEALVGSKLLDGTFALAHDF